jgi:PAS domain-containing protein
LAFDGLTAAGIVRAKWPAIPLILVSGTLGEELAIDSLKSGATDYVLKDRLTRLVPAVRRAMQEVEQSGRQNRRTEEALRETEQRLQAIFNESPLGIALVGVDGRPVLTNAALQKMLGYTGEELSRMPFTDFTHPDDCAKDPRAFPAIDSGRAQKLPTGKALHPQGRPGGLGASLR